MDLKEIEKQVEEIKARVMADSTILRFAILSQSTEQLLQMKANLASRLLSREPRLQRPNNSFKPRPLRGLAHAESHRAVRLNSGVSPQ